MTSPPEDAPVAHGNLPNPRPRGWLSGWRVLWAIVTLAALQSVAAMKLVMAALDPGGIIPGIAVLLLLATGIAWLMAVWILAALATFFRGPVMRITALVLLTGANLWCIPIFADDIRALTTVPPDMETGNGYFDAENERALVVAIWRCNPGLRPEDSACDLDKVASLARTTDIYAIGTGGESEMTLALQNGPNANVIRILLRTAKPPDEIVESIYDHARSASDLPLLRAALDGGLDPNYRYPRDTTPGDTYLATLFGWEAGMAMLLDAGADIDQTDGAGYTLLMQAIRERRYDVAAFLLARGASQGRTAPDGTSAATLVTGIPPEDKDKVPAAVLAIGAPDRTR